ncbi:unnamed protein product [Boreogadus saida]
MDDISHITTPYLPELSIIPMAQSDVLGIERHRKLLCHPAVTNELRTARRTVWSMKAVHMFSPFSLISNLL